MEDTERDVLLGKVQSLERQLAQVTSSPPAVLLAASTAHSRYRYAFLQAVRKEIDVERESQVNVLPVFHTTLPASYLLIGLIFLCVRSSSNTYVLQDALSEAEDFRLAAQQREADLQAQLAAAKRNCEAVTQVLAPEA